MKYAVKLEDGSYLVKRVHPSNPSKMPIIALMNALGSDALSPWLLSKGKAFAMASHIFGAKVIPWNPPQNVPVIFKDAPNPWADILTSASAGPTIQEIMEIWTGPWDQKPEA